MISFAFLCNLLWYGNKSFIFGPISTHQVARLCLHGVGLAICRGRNTHAQVWMSMFAFAHKTKETTFRLKSSHVCLSMVGSGCPSQHLPISFHLHEPTAPADADFARLEISLQQGCGGCRTCHASLPILRIGRQPPVSVGSC